LYAGVFTLHGQISWLKISKHGVNYTNLKIKTLVEFIQLPSTSAKNTAKAIVNN